MGSSLNHMSKTERRAIERFGYDVKSRLGDYVVRMSVFGSKVRGDFRETSDIDVLVIVKERSLRVMCVFRRKPPPDSDPFRHLIPIQVATQFRSIPPWESDPFRHPLEEGEDDAG